MIHRSSRKRELRGLQYAMNNFHISEGLIITLDEEEVIENDHDERIMVKPVWKWLLSH